MNYPSGRLSSLCFPNMCLTRQIIPPRWLPDRLEHPHRLTQDDLFNNYLRQTMFCCLGKKWTVISIFFWLEQRHPRRQEKEHTVKLTQLRAPGHQPSCLASLGLPERSGIQQYSEGVTGTRLSFAPGMRTRSQCPPPPAFCSGMCGYD